MTYPTTAAISASSSTAVVNQDQGYRVIRVTRIIRRPDQGFAAETTNIGCHPEVSINGSQDTEDHMVMPYKSTLGEMKKDSIAEATVASKTSNVVSKPPTNAILVEGIGAQDQSTGPPQRSPTTDYRPPNAAAAIRTRQTSFEGAAVERGLGHKDISEML